jgi:hypothetical protein
MKPARFAGIVLGLLLAWPVVGLAQVGTLAHDGPPTPEQISMYLPVTGSLTATSATVRYRPTSGSTWTAAHPLFRIRPNFTSDPVSDAFAGVITGLTPGIDYTVEVTVPNGGSPIVKTMTATTRSLPPAAGAPNKSISAGSSGSQVQSAFNGLNPGDVLQFANGTYNVDDLILDRSGTDSQPIYIRGASRSGVVLRDLAGHILYLLNASHIVFEDLTLEGPGVDSGTDASSEGIQFYDAYVQQKVTVRRVTIRGVDKGVAADDPIEQFLMYDCTLNGNNVWTQPFLETNLTWNDDGIRVPGFGNAVFNNTISGFGDTFAVDYPTPSAGVHFYRNDVRYTGDDAFEGDYGYRNITFYDNRIHNCMTLVSFDPISGGPAFIFRNIAINVGRSPYKFNNTNSGQFIYNNTIVRTNGFGSGQNWGWNQSNNGDQRAWGYRNNILIYRGAGNLMAFEAGGNDPIDFTNNAWYPDAGVWWSSSGGSYSSMAAARSGLPATTPVFATSTQRHQNDVITAADPFITSVVLGSTYLTQVTTMYVPFVANGTAPRSAGVAIPGITDGYSGAAPDMGAMITGIPAPAWGDRSGGGGPQDTVAPAPPLNLMAR